MIESPSAVGARTGEWLAAPGFGVYVHIPFCKHRCHYCDFNTYEGLDAIQGAYARSLVRSVGSTVGDFPAATSVFFGGGTPTLLAPDVLGEILAAIRDRMGIAPEAEITIEANPETVDERAFESLLARGFQRFSIGVQSLVPRVLTGLGRTHGPEIALGAIAAARRAGVEDLSADLIYGSPWECDNDWITSLEGIVDAGVDHVSAYALTVEEGTPLATLVATGRVPDVDPDVQAHRHEVAEEILGGAGFERYEVSNWARPGRASKHNVLYWSAGDYLGFGAGAHGHLDGRRYWNVRLPRDFIDAADAGRSTQAGQEIVADRAGEALMLGIRLASGVPVGEFAARFGPEALELREDAMAELTGAGLLQAGSGRITLTPRGTLLGNEVALRLL